MTILKFDANAVNELVEHTKSCTEYAVGFEHLFSQEFLKVRLCFKELPVRIILTHFLIFKPAWVRPIYVRNCKGTDIIMLAEFVDHFRLDSCAHTF